MPRFIIFSFLEGYAVFLALMQGAQGVRTDEAKYLLNIPYPHPPLVRWILGQTEWTTYQEIFWRIIFATILVQAVWVIWISLLCHGEPCRTTLARDTKGQSSKKIILGLSWLLSAALFIEGGKIMMAPLTAVQGLIFIYFLLKASETVNPLWLGMLWLVSLFTAYQAVLFLPIVVAIFWRMKISLVQKLMYIGGPLILLSLYTLINPLILVSFVSVGGQQVSVPFMERIGGVLNLWLLGGSVVVSVLGAIGMVRAKNIPLITSFIFVCLYIFVAHRAYYSVLFLPLLIGGMALLLKEEHFPVDCFGILMAVMLFVLVQDYLSSTPQDLVQRVLSQVPQKIGAGDILIAGPFGHQWQYRTHVPVRQYNPDLLAEAQAAICLSPCAEIEWRGWKRLMEDPVRVYVPEIFSPPLKGES